MVACQYSPDREVECSEPNCRKCLTQSAIKMGIAKGNLEAALRRAAEDEKIADGMRDYWMHKADGAER